MVACRSSLLRSYPHSRTRLFSSSRSRRVVQSTGVSRPVELPGKSTVRETHGPPGCPQTSVHFPEDRPAGNSLCKSTTLNNLAFPGARLSDVFPDDVVCSGVRAFAGSKIFPGNLVLQGVTGTRGFPQKAAPASLPGLSVPARSADPRLLGPPLPARPEGLGPPP